MISVRGLWKTFGPRVAVRDVSFDVRPGEVFVVMGLSGSGKSTLVRCLARLIEPTRGQILIGGEDVLSVSTRRLREIRRHTIAMVFQHFGLLPHRQVLDNVAYGLEIQGISRAERHARARKILSLVGLEGYDTAYPDQLSGGMQQRVGLARALCVDPEVLLLDEPFSALDPLIRRDMQSEIIRLHREVGKTLVFVTHDLAEALKLGDRIAIMREGEIVQTGSPQELVGAPADDYVADFVRDIPKAAVLTLRWIARPRREDEPGGGPRLPPDTLIRDAVRVALGSEQPVQVGDGVVDREAILAVIAELPESVAPAELTKSPKSLAPADPPESV